MFDSNTLASFALVISLISFWLSYITFSHNARRTSAEKRTEALSALRKTSMQLNDLLEKVQLADDTKLKRHAESQFSGIASSIMNLQEKVIKGVTRDAVMLEHVKAYATDVGEQAGHIAPELLGILNKTKLATVEQIEQANAAVREAIESANSLLSAVRATDLTGEQAEAIEIEILALDKNVGEMVTEMTTFINEILARGELDTYSAACCKNIAIEFTDGMNSLRMQWKASCAVRL